VRVSVDRFLAWVTRASMIAVGCALCLVALWIVGSSADNVRSAWRLRHGVQTTGEIVSVDEEIEDCDSCSGRIRRTYDVIYRFQTESGRAVENYVNVGYEPQGSEVAVIYNPANPLESRLAEARQSTVSGALGLFAVYTGLAAAIAVIGVSIIRDHLRKHTIQ